MALPEDEYRQLSELQHFVFCRRQWALIHIEGQWAENLRTVEGELMHKRVHDEKKTEKRGDTIIVRGMRVKSDTLQVVGICDVVEFTASEEGISLYGRRGKWLPRPVEYKRGKPKQDHSDELQLCGQAICLEEMLCCHIPEGDLFYGEPHRRKVVAFDEELRNEVKKNLAEMQALFQRGYTPKVKKHKGCANCSLIDICLPTMEVRGSVRSYIKRHLEEES